MVKLERAAEITGCVMLKLMRELEEKLFGRKNLLFLYDTNWTLQLCDCFKVLLNASLGTVMNISYGKETTKHHMTASYIYIMEINKNLLQSVTKCRSLVWQWYPYGYTRCNPKVFKQVVLKEYCELHLAADTVTT